ncbi:hypothetical protein [Trichormus variabilis]|nr:hypothetical protein [Trichormus variabilis]
MKASGIMGVVTDELRFLTTALAHPIQKRQWEYLKPSLPQPSL